jgi:hypothetical protein
MPDCLSIRLFLNRVGPICAVVLIAAGPAHAQETASGPDATPAAAAPADPGTPPDQQTAPAQAATTSDEEDTGISAVQPDFTVVNMQTTLHLPKFGSAFRLTHRFTRPVNAGDFGDFMANFLNFDNGAQIGLEYRFGVWTGLQAGIYRTSDRTIQLFGQYGVARQGHSLPVSIDALVAVDGTGNFTDDFSPTVGAIVSRTASNWLALYAEPIYVGNSSLATTGSDNTFVIGLGTRVRVRPSLYGTFEISPAVAGYTPGDPEIAFGIEGRVGGHVFQLNFSNSIQSTFASGVRNGGGDNGNWYIGFNLSRKFY